MVPVVRIFVSCCHEFYLSPPLLYSGGKTEKQNPASGENTETSAIAFSAEIWYTDCAF